MFWVIFALDPDPDTDPGTPLNPDPIRIRIRIRIRINSTAYTVSPRGLFVTWFQIRSEKGTAAEFCGGPEQECGPRYGSILPYVPIENLPT
jgi:hypothetical protein